MKVNVLLSAYNGEPYITQQIESILSQSHKDLHLYIRDDGSSDQTRNMLLAYAGDPRVTLLEGPNIGYAASFMALLAHAEDGDLWAFSDQDDIWLRDKIAWAVEWMDSRSKNQPLLFHSAYDLVDHELTRIGTVGPPKKRTQLHNVITDSVYQGFSLVMNRALRERLLRCDPVRMTSHDWMASLIVTEFGQAEYDPRVACLHRRTRTSVSGMTWGNRWRWFRRAFSGHSEVRATSREFMRIFSEELPQWDQRLLLRFTQDGFHLVNALLKAGYPKRWRRSLSSECAVRLLMLTGRI